MTRGVLGMACCGCEWGETPLRGAVRNSVQNAFVMLAVVLGMGC